MAGFRDADKALFPLKSISSVIEIFKNQLSSDREPDLALLSIIAGAVENSLTCRSNAALQVCEPVEPQSLPVLELHTVETLYSKFHSIMKSAVDVPKAKPKFATRALVKKVMRGMAQYFVRGLCWLALAASFSLELYFKCECSRKVRS